MRRIFEGAEWGGGGEKILDEYSRTSYDREKTGRDGRRRKKTDENHRKGEREGEKKRNGGKRSLPDSG